MTSLSIAIGTFAFPSKTAAIKAFREVLHRDASETEIVGGDADLVKALFFARSDKVAELKNRKIVRFSRRVHPHNTPCFFAELDDGSLLDFSFMKFINGHGSAAFTT